MRKRVFIRISEENEITTTWPSVVIKDGRKQYVNYIKVAAPFESGENCKNCGRVNFFGIRPNCHECQEGAEELKANRRKAGRAPVNVK